MPRKRWANPRLGGADVDASRAIPPSHESPPSSRIAVEVSKEQKFCSPGSSHSAPQKSESALSTYGGDLTEREEDSVSPPPTLLHSRHTSNGSDSASLIISQEDACAFHSPRSLPGDSSDAGGSMITLPAEVQAGNLRADAVDCAEQLQKLPEISDEGTASTCKSTAQHTRQTNLHFTTPCPQEAQQQHLNEAQREQHQTPVSSLHQQQLLSEQTKPAAGSWASDFLRRISPVSESESEWIRVEEPHRQDTEVANPENQTGSLPLTSESYSATVEPYVSSSSSSAFGTSRGQVSRYPVCIGSATQAEEVTRTEHSSIGLLSGMVYGEASEVEGWGACSSPAACSGTIQASRKGVLARLSLYVRSVSCCFTGNHGAQQKQESSSPNDRDDSTEAPGSQAELSELGPRAKQSPRRRGTLLQSMLECHRCILQMYGGAIEDITRLALQVLPAHAADDQSERRLLIIQGLFDVFCLYRSHFLSPPGELLQAEALHHQWKLRREYSLENTGISRVAGTSRTPVVPLLDGRPVGRGASTVEGLPTAVRLALYGAVSLALKIVRALQLLLEVSAVRRGGASSRFALCLRLELLKLILKLLLRALTPFSFYCDEQSICQALATQKEKQIFFDNEKLRPFYGRRTGRKIPPLPSAARQVAEDHQALIAAAAEQQLPRQWVFLVVVWLFNELKVNVSPSRLRGLLSLLNSAAWRPVLGEVLYHIRPFIHLYLLRRAKNTKSWTPWLVAIFIEANSISLLHGSPQVMEHLSPVEAAELHRRLTGLPCALLRPPFFDKFLARPVEAIDFVVRRVPLLNHFNVLDAFLAYRDLYFTTSNT